MRQALILHPDSHCAAATGVEVEAARPRPGALLLRYVVTGRIGDLRMPSAAAPKRAVGLWQHSCFEAFVRAATGAAYYEFNLAPSTQWAAFRFDGYRSGLRVAGAIDTPQIDVRPGEGRFALQASLALDRLPDLPADAVWRVGLAAVLEDADGRRTYWALAHPPGRPDFHHSDCFAVELPPA